jgi:serine/threonine-protein kinase
MSDAPHRLAAGTRLGSYRLTRCIGEGGMGTVYEGVHEGLGKRVAIKTLHAGSARSQELIARFVREGKAAAKIRHANVVDVFDVAVHEGTPYLVMEYLEGEDLGARMEHVAPMSPSAIADLMIPVISALSAAHEAGIVHRDLKPDNILICHGKGGSLEPKLVDFGISKLSDGESLHLTGTNAILGTPYYMSPEQAGSSKQVDHRSDIFSLGVILYQCATHELPFKGDSLFKLLGEILHSEPPRVSTLSSGVPPAFEAVIARAMKKDPAQRFQSATELGAALLPFASTRVRLGYEHEFGPAGDAAALQPSHADTGAAASTLEPMSAEVRATWRPGRSVRVLAALAVVGVCVALGIVLLARDVPDASGRLVGPVVRPQPAVSVPPPAPAIVTAPPAAIATAAPAAVTATMPARANDAGTGPVERDSTAEPATADADRTPAKDPRRAVERAARRGSRRERSAPAAQSIATSAAPAATPPTIRAEPPSASQNAPPADGDLFRDRK